MKKTPRPLTVTCVFPETPPPDNTERTLAAVKQLIAMGQAHEQRRDALIEKLRVAIQKDDVRGMRAASEALIELEKP